MLPSATRDGSARTIAYETITNELKMAWRWVSWLRTERASTQEASEAAAGVVTDAVTRRRPM
jgi:hypothetical protein